MSTDRWRSCLPVVLLLAGCSALEPNGGGGATLRPVSASLEDAVGDDVETRSGPERSPARVVAGWADRQRFIFERAWREIRADLDYESIDSFATLGRETRREDRALRDEMAAARDVVTPVGGSGVRK